MRFRHLIPTLVLASVFSFAPAHAAVSLPIGQTSTAVAPETAEGPAKEALEAFKAGRHAKAVELARPLAEKGNADALYLMGFASETGQGLTASRDKALEYYRKAADSKQKDAVYRLAFILLASEKKDERDQARQTLEKASQDDPAVAGRILGEAYLRGMLTEKPDGEKAVTWWKRAADAGDLPSLMLLGKLYEGQFGFSELKNLKAAMESYAKAAGLGDPGAMTAYGSRLLSGDKSVRDEAKGVEWCKKAITAKDYNAYLVLGDYEENTKKNPKEALSYYERGKDAGQVDCMLRAADAYIEGKGVEKDADRGFSILQKAAEGGSPIAALRLAASKLSGDKPDYGQGYAYLLAAANGGLPQAQNELGLFYLAGKLAGADGPAAVAWLTRSAQGGFAQAQFNLAAIYERGAAGVQQNFENAGQLYTLAANQGHPAATLALSRFVENGLGTKADGPKAWALASLAAERGAKEAEDVVKRLNEKLDRSQLDQGKKELENIKSGKPTEAKPANEKPADAKPR